MNKYNSWIEFFSTLAFFMSIYSLSLVLRQGFFILINNTFFVIFLLYVFYSGVMVFLSGKRLIQIICILAPTLIIVFISMILSLEIAFWEPFYSNGVIWVAVSGSIFILLKLLARGHLY